MVGINGSVSYDTSHTGRQYGAFQAQYDYFNRELFGSELPFCLLTFSRSGKKCAGFFAPERWLDGEKVSHEIALNPEFWNTCRKEAISTLVHEMCHLWQQVFGTPGRKGYHNKEWGDKMKQVGLHPSNTGAPGGKETGQQMSDYVIEGGRLQLALEAMPEELWMPLEYRPVLKIAAANKTKTKYQCPVCEAKIWGKDNLSVRCLDCDRDFEIQD